MSWGWMPKAASGVALILAANIFGHVEGCNIDPKTAADRCAVDARAEMYVGGASREQAAQLYNNCMADAGRGPSQ